MVLPWRVTSPNPLFSPLLLWGKRAQPQVRLFYGNYPHVLDGISSTPSLKYKSTGSPKLLRMGRLYRGHS